MTNKLAILALTTGGKKLAKHLAHALTADNINIVNGIANTTSDIWHNYDGLIFIMATGIVVRSIAPLIANKQTDPAIVVIDEAGKHAISLLSGHLGGANKLAVEIATITGGEAVITTASDTLGFTPIDLWAKYNNLTLGRGSFTALSAKLVNHGCLTLWSDLAGDLPPEFIPATNPDKVDLIISNRLYPQCENLLYPKNLIVGIGCNRGVSVAEIRISLAEICRNKGLNRQAVAAMASLDLKSDEEGLLEFCKEDNLAITFYTASQLNTICPSRSAVVFKATGAYGVCEPAALLRAATDKLLHGKTKWTNVTIAIAQNQTRLTANYQ